MLLLEKKWKDRNLLTKIEEKNEVFMDEDCWNHNTDEIHVMTPETPLQISKR
jgi:hypothetical protein